MSDPDTRLAALWSATEAPARDIDFELAVEARIASRRLLIELTGWSAAAAAVIAAVWGMWPALAPVLRDMASPFIAAGPVLAAVAAILGAWLWLARSPDHA
jgi:hypothetical protein